MSKIKVKGVGSGNGDNPFRMHGRGAGNGYSEYRYGSKRRSKVYVPGQNDRRKALLGDKQARDDLVAAVAAQLRDWTLSPFEHEAAARHGLRQGFCEKGNAWDNSDSAAAFVVSEALLSNGAKRPTWEEGQWHHTAGQENCAWCFREIDDPTATRGQRYCSTECATSAIQHRGGRDAARYDSVVRQAYRQVQKSKAEPRPCKHCGTLFRSPRKNAEYCSVKCVRHGTGYIRPNSECPVCNGSFKPARKEQIYCSLSCGGTAARAAQRETMPTVSCRACEGPFKPAVEGQHYCSTTCRKRVENIAQRLRKGVNVGLSRLAFDIYFTEPFNAAHAAQREAA